MALPEVGFPWASAPILDFSHSQTKANMQDFMRYPSGTDFPASTAYPAYRKIA